MTNRQFEQRRKEVRTQMVKHTLKVAFLRVVFFVAAVVIMAICLGNAIDRHFEAQDRMLCRSAEVSGNIEYLNKCK